MINWSTSDVAGVNFGDSHITVARIRGDGKNAFEVTHAGWGDYDPGAPEAKIAMALKALWRKAGLPTTTVVASLRSASLVVRCFKYPAMPEEELRSALRLQAEESLQMTGDQVVVDWHINRGGLRREGGGQEGGTPIQGVLAAAPVKDVKRVLSILFMAGLDPIVLDVRALAVANLYATLTRRNDDATVCMVSLAPHSADVVVLSRTGEVYPHTVFCRASTWRQSPEFLCENIRDAVKYSEFKLNWEPVQKVVLTGDVPPGDFAGQIRQGVEIPVDVWNPLTSLVLRSRRVKRLLASSPDQASMLVPSLGLSLRRG